MKKYNRTKEELEKIIKLADEDFPRHYRKVGEITIDTVLKPNEVIEIAKKYHRENKLDGVVNEQIESLFFDEEYTFIVDIENRENDDIRTAWRVTVDLQPNQFIFEEYTLIVSDRDKTVLGILDVNGHPVSEGNEYTDKDIEYIRSNEVTEEDKG